MLSIASAKALSSIATSSSQLPIQLAMLRLVEPTRAQRPSATAVLAWSIGPFHSKIAHARLQQRAVAGAGQRLGDRDVADAGDQQADIDAVAGGFAQGLDIGGGADEIGVGEPQPVLDAGGDQQVQAVDAHLRTAGPRSAGSTRRRRLGGCGAGGASSRSRRGRQRSSYGGTPLPGRSGRGLRSRRRCRARVSACRSGRPSRRRRCTGRRRSRSARPPSASCGGCG